MSFKIFTLIFILFISGCEKNSTDAREMIAIATYVDHVVLNKIRNSFINELKRKGYTKESGWNIIIKSANGQANEANLVAGELLNMKPKVLVSISTPSTKPIFDKNQGIIPHVYSFVSFPESIGITEDAINTTGLSDGIDFEANINFIKQIIPNIKSLGMVFSDEPNAIVSRDEVIRLCKKNGINFIGQSVSKEDEVKQAIQSISFNNKVDAILVGADGVVVNQIKAMIEVTNAYKIPLFAIDEGSVENGAFAAISVNYESFGKETAILVDNVIKKGTANGFDNIKYYGKDIVINLNTAKIIDIIVPEYIIKDAYKVIQ